MANRRPVQRPRPPPVRRPNPAVPSQNDRVIKEIRAADEEYRKLARRVDQQNYENVLKRKEHEMKVKQVKRDSATMWICLGVLGVVLLIGVVLLVVKMVKSRKEKARQQSAQQVQMSAGYGVYGTPQPQMVYPTSPVDLTMHSPTYGAGAAPSSYHPGTK